MKKGQLIDKKYFILESLGSGGTSNVYLVKKEQKSEEIYAGKVLIEENESSIFQ